MVHLVQAVLDALGAISAMSAVLSWRTWYTIYAKTMPRAQVALRTFHMCVQVHTFICIRRLV